jgi:hypothetical protein
MASAFSFSPRTAPSNPGDLDAFVAKIIEEIKEGKHQRKAA